MLDYEVLMMEALDGTISPSDQARLDSHLDAHPDARAMFDAMQGVEAALSAAPIIEPRQAFTQTVMTATRGIAMARPLHGRHIALIVGTNALFVALGWALIISACTALAMSLAPSGLLHVLSALGRGALGALGTVARAGRIVFEQPVTWAAMLACMSILALWSSVMVRLFRPTQRLARH
jgi:anti-sigma factor RsiW